MEALMEFQQKLELFAQNRKDGICIIEAETEKSFVYGDLLYAVMAVRKLFGKEGQTILIDIPGSITTAIVWLAALTGGHTLIPVSPALTTYEYEAVVKKHTPGIIISLTDPKISGIQWITPDRLEAVYINISYTDTFLKPAPGSVYLTTSGSTGTPKGMLLDITKILYTAEQICMSHQLTEEDRGLTVLPFHHVNAPVVSLMSGIYSGGTVIIAPKFSVSKFWSWVKIYDPTWISIVPTVVAILLSTDKPDFLDTSSLRFIRTASAPLPMPHLLAFEKKFHVPLIETYGLSEAASTVAANPVPPGIHKPGSAGLPLGVELRICQKNNPDVAMPVNESGEIYIKGSNIISYYEDNRGEDAFNNEWLNTGDVGYIDNEGYLFITGRTKDMIIRGGENISPREVEDILLSYTGVREAAVVGLADPIYGEQVAAFLVLAEKMKVNISKDIQIYAAKYLSKEKVPAQIYILDELPRGHTGKIDRRELRAYAI